MSTRAVLALWLMAPLSACAPEASDAVIARLQRAGHLVDATLGEAQEVRYLGFEVTPAQPAAGEDLHLVHYWRAQKPLPADYRVFVHVLAQGARGWVENGDHDAETPTSGWQPGQIVRSEHRLTLPQFLPADAIELRLGLYDKRLGRLPPDAAHDDGDKRVRAGFISILGGSPVPLPRYEARRLTAPPQIDGHIDEAEWGGAPFTTPFVATSGRGTTRHRAEARLAWDDGHLYVAMRSEDADVHSSASQRDDGVWKEDAHELYLDADGDADDYIELEVSPRAVLMDCSFKGGARKNGNLGFTADFTAAASVDGTLNDSHDQDRSWSSEWALGFATLTELGRAPHPGECWRMNLFNVGKEPGQRADESAWSPPLMGDFHNLSRLGQLCFSP